MMNLLNQIWTAALDRIFSVLDNYEYHSYLSTRQLSWLQKEERIL